MSDCKNSAPTLTGISDLPPELLNKIFAELAADGYQDAVLSACLASRKMASIGLDPLRAMDSLTIGKTESDSLKELLEAANKCNTLQDDGGEYKTKFSSRAERLNLVTLTGIPSTVPNTMSITGRKRIPLNTFTISPNMIMDLRKTSYNSLCTSPEISAVAKIFAPETIVLEYPEVHPGGDEIYSSSTLSNSVRHSRAFNRRCKYITLKNFSVNSWQSVIINHNRHVPSPQFKFFINANPGSEDRRVSPMADFLLAQEASSNDPLLINLSEYPEADRSEIVEEFSKSSQGLGIEVGHDDSFVHIKRSPIQKNLLPGVTRQEQPTEFW